MSAPAPASPKILDGLGALAGRYDILLCDIWGVLHDGRRHFPAAADALKRWRAGGGKVVLITNAPRPFGPIQAQLDELGAPRAAYDGMVTSGDVTMALIAAKGAARVWHIGPPRDLALFEEVREAGGAPVLAALDDAEYAVCTGLFDDDSETPEDYSERLERMLARKMPMICANPDLVVHRGATLLYCAGALAQAYAAMGGEAAYAGKPHAPIYERALAMAGAKPGDRVLAIGDAMATDMRGARSQGIDAMLVSNGIHRGHLHPKGDPRLREDRLREFLADEAAPRFAMAQLSW